VLYSDVLHDTFEEELMNLKIHGENNVDKKDSA